MTLKISRTDTTNSYFALQKKARKLEQKFMQDIHSQLKSLEAEKQGYDYYMHPVFNGMKNKLFKFLAKK
ncbi:hypothetical protein IJE86_05535 [bacterium]|nr:hypothetical protein [bacterium]